MGYVWVMGIRTNRDSCVRRLNTSQTKRITTEYIMLDYYLVFHLFGERAKWRERQREKNTKYRTWRRCRNNRKTQKEKLCLVLRALSMGMGMPTTEADILFVSFIPRARTHTIYDSLYHGNTTPRCVWNDVKKNEKNCFTSRFNEIVVWIFHFLSSFGSHRTCKHMRSTWRLSCCVRAPLRLNCCAAWTLLAPSYGVVWSHRKAAKLTKTKSFEFKCWRWRLIAHVVTSRCTVLAKLPSHHHHHHRIHYGKI